MGAGGDARKIGRCFVALPAAKRQWGIGNWEWGIKIERPSGRGSKAYSKGVQSLIADEQC